MNNLYKKTRNKKAISLISLVITIVIVIILSTAIIIGIVRQNMIKDARIATEENNMKQSIEILNMKVSKLQIDSYEITGNASNLAYIANGLENDSEIEYVIKYTSLSKEKSEKVVCVVVKLVDSSYKMKVDENLKIEIIDEEPDENIYDGNDNIDNGNSVIPEGYVKPEGTISINEFANNIDVSNYSYADTTSLQNLGFNFELDDKLKEKIADSNVKIDMNDIMTQKFYNQLADNDIVKSRLIESEAFYNSLTNFNDANLVISSLGIGVKNYYNSSNALWSSVCDNGDYKGYQAFTDTTAYWCSKRGIVNNSYVGYNFKEKKMNVKYFRFFNGGDNAYRAKEIKLEYSDDNKKWEAATDVITLENVSKDNFIKNTKENQAHQYWRVFILSGYDGSYVGCQRLDFFGTVEE